MGSSWIVRWGGAGAALAAVLCVSPRAEALGDGAIGLVVAAALLPSEAGVAVDGSLTKGLVGWSWQVPVLHCGPYEHRVVGGLEVLPWPGGPSWRGRLGYRYATGRWLAGVGPELDGRGFSLSPEVGIKFLHLEHTPNSPSLHLISRAQLAKDGLRGATVMLGWNAF